ISAATATGNLIQGNYIGVNAAGTGALGNTLNGVAIHTSVTGTTIGGTVAGAGNVISGNDKAGIWLTGAVSNLIAGNFIGTAADGNLVGVKADGTTLLLNATGALDVTNGATLKGTGSFTGNVGNAGTVSPGNSPGIVTINGNYTQSSPGILNIEIAGTNAS